MARSRCALSIAAMRVSRSWLRSATTFLNRQAREWVTHHASERIHGTTRKKPSALFNVERSALLPLPGIAPDLGVWQPVKVHRDCHVAYERALYSVPFRLVGVCGVRLLPLVDALREATLNEPVVHVDETPVQVLQPGSRKNHRAYLWAYAPGAFQALKAVVYDFTEGRSGAHARAFLGDWRGELVCDDYGGYKACFEQGMAEAGCMAHARRKFFELHQSGKSQIAEQALKSIGQLYEIETRGASLPPAERQRLRDQQARPIAEALHAWMTAHRLKVPDSTGIARALDYSLKRWAALTRYLDDGRLPIDNNWIENPIRPIALGRKNWLFAGSQRAPSSR